MPDGEYSIRALWTADNRFHLHKVYTQQNRIDACDTQWIACLEVHQKIPFRYHGEMASQKLCQHGLS